MLGVAWDDKWLGLRLAWDNKTIMSVVVCSVQYEEEEKTI